MRVVDWLMTVFALSALLLLVQGVAPRFVSPTFASALRELHDGAPDRDERLALERLLRDEGLRRLQAGDVRAGLIAAMAAIELDDAGGYQRIADRLRGRLTLVAGGGPAPGAPAAAAALAAEAALGEPYLRDLMLGHDAEHRGARQHAADLFARARRSAQLYRAPLARLLAVEGLSRSSTPR